MTIYSRFKDNDLNTCRAS